MTATLQERMQATRRRQNQALSGDYKPTARVRVAANDPPPATTVHLPAAAPNAAQLLRGRNVVLRAREGELREFELLVDAVAKHYGYDQTDVEFIRKAVSADNPIAHRELALCIRQWRIDLVTHGLDGQLVPDVANRARVQFRQDVMGEGLDENGAPYRDDVLEFVPAPWELVDLAPMKGTRAPRP